MKNENLKKIWKDWWNGSKFIRSLFVTGKAIWLTVQLGWNNMWALFRKYPEPPIAVLFVLLLFSNIFWYAKYKVDQDRIGQAKFKAEREVDQKIIFAEKEGHDRAIMEIKAREQREKDSIREAERKARVKIKTYERKDSSKTE